jgi:formylglycine-generating enzyme required for sulfatase activity
MPKTLPPVLVTNQEVLIPAGPFLFGEELEQHYVAPFSIDRYPVTVRRFARYIEETGRPAPANWPDRRPPEKLLDHPVTGVSFFDAAAFAASLGRTLPTEEQWEKAARGTDGRVYPWGNRFNLRNLNSRASKKRLTTPVNLYPDGVSPFGVMDLVGNVWEWTLSWFDLIGDLKVLKGGCYALTKEHARTCARHFNDPAFGNNLTGFRTVGFEIGNPA